MHWPLLGARTPAGNKTDLFPERAYIAVGEQDSKCYEDKIKV